MKLSRLKFSDYLFYILSFPMIFYYYLGSVRSVTLISYFLSILVLLVSWNNDKPQKKVSEIISVILFLFVCFYSVFIFDTIEAYVYSLRLFFGIFLFLIAFDSIRLPNIKFIAIFLSTITLIEKVLILIYPQLIFVLNNYDGGITFSLQDASNILGGVHSFGANRTVSAVILLAIFIYLDLTKHSKAIRLLVLSSSFLCVSGTAILISFVYFTIKFLRKIEISIKGLFLFFVIVFVFVNLYSIFFVSDFEDAALHRFSSLYYEFIIEYKSDQIIDLYTALNPVTFFTGMGSESITSFSSELGGSYGSRYGDFIILDFISKYGLLGILSFIIMVLANIKTSYGKVVFWILFIGTLHYHVLFSGPSQVLLPYIFKLKNKFYK